MIMIYEPVVYMSMCICWFLKQAVDVFLFRSNNLWITSEQLIVRELENWVSLFEMSKWFWTDTLYVSVFDNMYKLIFETISVLIWPSDSLISNCLVNQWFRNDGLYGLYMFLANFFVCYVLM